MEEAIKEHLEKFGKEPVIIGMFWSDHNELIDKVYDAIDSGEPYDEYKLLSKKEREAYDKGELHF